MIITIICVAILAAVCVWPLLKAAAIADKAIEVVGEKSDGRAEEEATNAFAWIVFHVLAIWSSCSRWFRIKRVCSWHQPAEKWIGGNPMAPRKTHGMCPECFARVSAEIMGHANAGIAREAQRH